MNKQNQIKLNEWIDAQTYSASVIMEDDGNGLDFLLAHEMKTNLPQFIDKMMGIDPDDQPCGIYNADGKLVGYADTLEEGVEKCMKIANDFIGDCGNDDRIEVCETVTDVLTEIVVYNYDEGEKTLAYNWVVEMD